MTSSPESLKKALFTAQTVVNLPATLHPDIVHMAQVFLDQNNVPSMYIEDLRPHVRSLYEPGFEPKPEPPAENYDLENQVIEEFLQRHPDVNISLEYPGHIRIYLYDGRSVGCGSRADTWWLQFDTPEGAKPDFAEHDHFDPQYANDGERDPIQLAWLLAEKLLRTPWGADILVGPRPTTLMEG